MTPAEIRKLASAFADDDDIRELLNALADVAEQAHGFVHGPSNYDGLCKAMERLEALKP